MPEKIISNGAKIECSLSCSLNMNDQVPLGSESSFPDSAKDLVILSTNGVFANNEPVANINDNSYINIPPFTSCRSMSNVTVQSSISLATSKNNGIPTFSPGTCIPFVPTPWNAGSTSCTLRKSPFLKKGSNLICSTGNGIIKISDPNPKIQNVQIN